MLIVQIPYVAAMEFHDDLSDLLDDWIGLGGTHDLAKSNLVDEMGWEMVEQMNALFTIRTSGDLVVLIDDLLDLFQLIFLIFRRWIASNEVAVELDDGWMVFAKQVAYYRLRFEVLLLGLLTHILVFVDVCDLLDS